ncbi:MAG TPA: PaaI family thioesterase [Nevskiaceae bacterium]|nr:PaaI family thioesterase [Nevskiaceae bacterium]
MSTPYLDQLRRHYAQWIPHARDCGLEATEVSAESAVLRLPWRPDWLGDPGRGRLHTGLLTMLADSTCGIALLARIGEPQAVATLDLRMDYLRASLAGRDLWCRAQCHRLTPQIAFVRGSLWQDDPAQPVAEVLATFMRGRAGSRVV